MKKSVILIMVVFLICSLFIIETLASGDTLEKIVKSGTVKVGFCVDIPPIKFRDQNNKPAGLCADLAEAFARDLGVKLEYVFSDWAGLIPMLLSNRSDIIFGNMSATLERAKMVNFSDTWLVQSIFVIVRNDSEWKSYKDLNREDVNIGCNMGTISETTFKKFIPKAKLMTYTTNVEQYLALEQGRIEAVANETIYAKAQVSRSEGKLRMLPEPLAADPWGFTLRADDFHFLTWTNLWLRHLKDSGEYDKMLNYWLTDEWKKDYPDYS